MNKTIHLDGIWDFMMDCKKEGLAAHYEQIPFQDVIALPATTSEARKGIPNEERNTGFLTDPYQMEGYCWYRRTLSLPYDSVSDLNGHHFILTLERTRISYVWVDGVFVGSYASFVGPHEYDLTPFLHSTNPVLTIMISNTDYPVPGGHMTSPDTQTNWNGILGSITLTCYDSVRIQSVITSCDYEQQTANLTLRITNYETSPVKAALSVTSQICRLADISANRIEAVPAKITPAASSVILQPGAAEYQIAYRVSEDAVFWDEYDPSLYHITASVSTDAGAGDQKSTWFGLKQFITDGEHFLINGRKTFLRGKHDGMLFPLTGYAPMDVWEWIRVMSIAKDFGINHYRFHTCCPPEAAFLAADLLGIYMQPEISFWGTFNGPEDEGYDETAQGFLEQEGFRMLESFSNHPSYCMMSMGNELWGNPAALNELLGKYKAFRPQVLYTQGSNNFFWMPNIQPNDDFFSGVRFTIDRQIRGSFAMCDKPLGHTQSSRPETVFSYDESIRPPYTKQSAKVSEDGMVEIQYGTGVKRVRLVDTEGELIPNVPVISHEVGQYEVYPDYEEISHYTGVLKPRNLEVFRERLEEKKLLPLAHDYFVNSGALAVACYKDELEAFFRSAHLAGFQLLDLQDFTGQGTALVGVLNSLFENKGLITAEEFRMFCSDAVLQAEFEDFVVKSGQDFHFAISLSYYRNKALCHPSVSYELRNAATRQRIDGGCNTIETISENGRHILGRYTLSIPKQDTAQEYLLTVSIDGTDITNHYTLWSYPEPDPALLSQQPEFVAYTVKDALALAKNNKHVLLFLSDAENPHSIEGTYCTDFWCYPMFRSISESVGKEVAPGTMGLLIQKDHPALSLFPTRTYTTPQWYAVINASRSTILDDTTILPVVQTIDNFERNHRLGLLYEVYLTDLDCRLFICTSDLKSIIEADGTGSLEAAMLYQSLIRYAASPSDTEAYAITSAKLLHLLAE